MLFFFFFIIDLYFLIPTMIAQMFISTAELVIPTETQTNKANAEIETQPATAEDRISQVCNLILKLTCILIFFTH